MVPYNLSFKIFLKNAESLEGYFMTHINKCFSPHAFKKGWSFTPLMRMVMNLCTFTRLGLLRMPRQLSHGKDQFDLSKAMGQVVHGITSYTIKHCGWIRRRMICGSKYVSLETQRTWCSYTCHLQNIRSNSGSSKDTSNNTIRQISTHPSGACQFILCYANCNDITSSLLLLVIIWGKCNLWSCTYV